jgi:hypothetical protein
MREQINNNPLVQVGIVAMLLLAAAFFFVSSTSGGGGEEESEAAEATATTITTAVAEEEEAATTSLATALAQVDAAGSAPPPPPPVFHAWASGQTLVLLFIHNGGIDDRVVRDATESLAGLTGVATFVIPADRISRYAAITEGVAVDRVPALVVVAPKSSGGDTPAASVSYGLRSGQSVVQAVLDAGYDGPTIDYHP